MGYCLLTGATGFLGSYLLHELQTAGTPVAVLVRPRRTTSSHQRIDTVLKHWEQSTGRSCPRPVVLAGDLHESGLGLPRTERAWIANHCTQVLHSAASVRFNTPPGGHEPHRSNVEGTRHMLDMCAETGVRTFHHVSTAYVSGSRTGRVLEDELTAGQAFGNDYEHSKFEAERLVRAADFLDTATVFRPSIILGDSRTGYASSFQGFYRMLQLASLLYTQDSRLLLSGLGLLEQLGLSGDERKNVVTVDWVASVISELVRHPSHHGKTYHVTNEHPVTVREMFDTAVEAILTGLQQSKRQPALVQATPLDEPEFRRQWDTYRAYLRDDAEFDRGNLLHAVPHLDAPALEHQTMLKLFEVAIHSGFRAHAMPHPTPGFDLSGRLRPLLDAHTVDAGRNPAQCLQLEASGPGGGAWRIGFDDSGPTQAAIGMSQDASIGVYLHVHTMEALCRKTLDIQSAIEQGLLVLEGSPALATAGIQLMGSLRDYLTISGEPTVSRPSVAAVSHRGGQ